MSKALPATAALRPRRLGVLLLAASTLLLGACKTQDWQTGSILPPDHRERHPIVLRDGAQALDVFVGANGGLDPRQRGDIEAFAHNYRRYGKGGMVAHLPVGTRSDASVRHGFEGVRNALAAHGVGVHAVTYPIQDPSLAAPIRLVYSRLEAQVGGVCGQWPRDLASGSSIEGWKNEPYWNFGCSTQNTLASQVADPLDLVRARPESAIDVVKRKNGIDKLRQGQDPSTVYRQQTTTITRGVGN